MGSPTLEHKNSDEPNYILVFRWLLHASYCYNGFRMRSNLSPQHYSAEPLEAMGWMKC
jgi:hypothetical protein